MCEEKKRRKKYWFFGWHELPYFIAIIVGIVLTIIGLVLMILFSPPIIDLVSLFISIVGSLISISTWLSSLSKEYFDKTIKELRNEIRDGFSRLETLLKELLEELRKR